MGPSTFLLVSLCYSALGDDEISVVQAQVRVEPSPKGTLGKIRDEISDFVHSVEATSMGSQHAHERAAHQDTVWKEVFVPVGLKDSLGKPLTSHSQVGQDKLVQSILQCKRDGFFVDLAANEAVDLSNSLMLERDFGWKGICIDANPYYVPGLAERQCKTVLTAVGSPTGQQVDFAYKGAIGGIIGDEFDNKHEDKGGEKVTMRTTALEEILVKMGAPLEIDYMSLDVEGAESLVMMGFPWDKFKFHVLTVERPKEDLKAKLKEQGYHFLMKNSDFDDQTWIHESLPNFETVSSKEWKIPTDEEFSQACSQVDA